MNVTSSPLCSLAAQLGRLSVASVSVARTSVRLASTSRKRKQRIEPNFKPGHGEKIWIFSNFVNGQTVYSHNPVLKANKALRQLPFNGKKLKPAKLRKDYWRPTAMVQFPEGMGHVGRSVYHLMRQFRAAHDLGWGDDMLRDAETGRVLRRHERGERLNASQKANAVADLAVVLGGAGKGNKMRVEENDKAHEGLAADAAAAAANGLHRATVFWADELDKNYAVEWPANVAHSSFRESIAVPVEEVEAVELVEEEVGAEAEPEQGKQTRQSS